MYSGIIIDPPYDFSDRLKMDNTPRGAEANYPTLDLDAIKNLKINELANPDGCILALWVPSSMLQDGLDIMKAYGFHQKQTFIWVKTKKEKLNSFKKWIKTSILNHPQISYDKFSYKRAIKSIINSINDIDLNENLGFFMGRLFRNTHEIALIGINNNGIYKDLANKSQRTVSFAENLKHSEKPEYLHKSLELMFPEGKFLEVFARRKREGWTCIGNEMCDGEDIRVSINKLIEENEVLAA